MVRPSSRFAALWLTLLGVLAGGAPPVRALTPESAVEAAPAIYRTGPSRTGRTWEMTLPSVAEVDYICRLAMGGPPVGAQAGFYYWGCYDVRQDAVVLVDPKAWPSRREWNLAREHEWAHARGWRHLPNGRGTDWARSLPPAGLSQDRFRLASRADGSLAAQGGPGDATLSAKP